MRMMRTFHPVGQGGFCTEQWQLDDKNLTIAYDCGSESKDCLCNEINAFVNTKQPIDVLVLSHLHNDHMNGVQYLIERQCVKCILLPVISVANEVELLLSNFLRDSFSVNEVDLYQKLLHDETIQEVKIKRISYTEDNVSDETPSEVLSNAPDGIKDEIMRVWKYKLYNPKQEADNEINELIDEIKSNKHFANARFIKEDGIDYELLKNVFLDKKLRKELVRIYKEKMGKNHNAYSMMLYSGTKTSCAHLFMDCYHHYFHHCHCFHAFCDEMVGCMYCGDANLKNQKSWNQFEQFFQKELNDGQIGMWQIPHHGSQHNYNANISKGCCPRLNIILASTTNRYKHPHSTTLKQIMGNNAIPLWVSEERRSEVEFRIGF